MKIAALQPISKYPNSPMTPNFKASVSPKLKEALQNEARKTSPEALERLSAKIAEVSSWGSARVELQKVQNELSKKGAALAINWENFPAYFDRRVAISQRLSLLDQFFALRPDHITTAEKELKKTYESANIEVIARIVEDPELIEVLTGSPEFDANKIAYKMENLTQQELVDFLKKPKSYLIEKYGK